MRTKAEFTIFEDAPGYWFVPRSVEASARAAPAHHRASTTAHPTKIAACRAARAQAVAMGATELHLHGLGVTNTIKREATAKGLKPFIYWPSAVTRIAPFQRASRAYS